MKPQYINMSEKAFTEMCEELSEGSYVGVYEYEDGELGFSLRVGGTNNQGDLVVIGGYEGEDGFDGDDDEKLEIAAEWAEKSILRALEGKE